MESPLYVKKNNNKKDMNRQRVVRLVYFFTLEVILLMTIISIIQSSFNPERILSEYLIVSIAHYFSQFRFAFGLTVFGLIDRKYVEVARIKGE